MNWKKRTQDLAILEKVSVPIRDTLGIRHHLLVRIYVSLFALRSKHCR